VKYKATIMDERYSGFAFWPHDPVVAPIRIKPKWRFWAKPKMVWGVVQPKREVFGPGVEWVWRHIAVFTNREDAVEFLNVIESKEGRDDD
jgi:hypothetical protein